MAFYTDTYTYLQSKKQRVGEALLGYEELETGEDRDMIDAEERRIRSYHSKSSGNICLWSKEEKRKFESAAEYAFLRASFI